MQVFCVEELGRSWVHDFREAEFYQWIRLRFQITRQATKHHPRDRSELTVELKASKTSADDFSQTALCAYAVSIHLSLSMSIEQIGKVAWVTGALCGMGSAISPK